MIPKVGDVVTYAASDGRELKGTVVSVKANGFLVDADGKRLTFSPNARVKRIKTYGVTCKACGKPADGEVFLFRGKPVGVCDACRVISPR